MGIRSTNERDAQQSSSGSKYGKTVGHRRVRWQFKSVDCRVLRPHKKRMVVCCSNECAWRWCWSWCHTDILTLIVTTMYCLLSWHFCYSVKFRFVIWWYCLRVLQCNKCRLEKWISRVTHMWYFYIKMLRISSFKEENTFYINWCDCFSLKNHVIIFIRFVTVRTQEQNLSVCVLNEV